MKRKVKRKKTDTESEGQNACIIRIGGGCNQKCSYCSYDRSKELSLEDIYDIVVNSTERFVMLECQGEPLISPMFVDIIHTIRRAGAVRIGLVTNGRMLAYERVALLLAELKLDIVLITINHILPEVHDKVTGVKGSFEQTVKGLKNFIAVRHKGSTFVYIRFVPIKENRGFLLSILDFAIKSGVNGVVIDSLQNASNYDAGAELRDSSKKDLIISRRRLEEKFKAGLSQSFSDAGSLPIRFHEEEKAISMVLRTGCKNACNFCTTRIVQEERNVGWPLDKVDFFFKDISFAGQKGFETLRIVAIEPLEHPDIIKLVSFASRSGFSQIEVWTSARALKDRKFTGDIKKAGLTSVDVPLMGGSATIHDEVTGSRGAFEETIIGLENARSSGLNRKIHFILTVQNLNDMDGMIETGRVLGIHPPSSVLIPSASSQNLRQVKSFLPSYTSVVRELKKLSKEKAEILVEMGLGNNIPPCIFYKEKAFFNLVQQKSKIRINGYLKEGNLSQPGAKMKVRVKCVFSGRCKMSDACPGIHAMYGQIYGMGEFLPFE